jgi:hypothetical protein
LIFAWNHGWRSPFPVTKPIAQEPGVNTRMHTIEDAARLAMGNFMSDDASVDPARAAYVTLRIAAIAGAVAVAALLGIAYL